MQAAAADCSKKKLQAEKSNYSVYWCKFNIVRQHNSGHEISQHVGLFLLQALHMQLWATTPPGDCASNAACGGGGGCKLSCSHAWSNILKLHWRVQLICFRLRRVLLKDLICAAEVFTELMKDGWQPPEIYAIKAYSWQKRGFLWQTNNLPNTEESGCTQRTTQIQNTCKTVRREVEEDIFMLHSKYSQLICESDL